MPALKMDCEQCNEQDMEYFAANEIMKESYFCASKETGLGGSIWYITFSQNVVCAEQGISVKSFLPWMAPRICFIYLINII